MMRHMTFGESTWTKLSINQNMFFEPINDDQNKFTKNYVKKRLKNMALI